MAPELSGTNRAPGASGTQGAGTDKTVEERRQAERFRHPLVRGVGVGRRHNLVYSGKELDDNGRIIPQFEGSATVWVTLKDGGGTFLRDWPDGWKGPSRTNIVEGYDSWEISKAQIDAVLQRKSEECEALISAEKFHGDPNSHGKDITRVEAVLIEAHRQCWQRAVKFLEFTRLLNVPQDSTYEPKWPVQEQAAGKALFLQLQTAYTPRRHTKFRSPEACSMTAAWLVTEWDHLGDLFEQNLQFFDRALYEGQQILFQGTGATGSRGKIIGCPLRNNTLININGLVNTKTINKSIVTTFEQLLTLSNISPIANEALFGARRRPTDAQNAPAHALLQPVLPRR